MSKWTKKQRDKLYVKALECFGEWNQLSKLREELDELKHEAGLMMGWTIVGYDENIFSEIADVTIMIEQLTNILNSYDKDTLEKIQQQKEYKLNRLEKRLNEK